MDNSVKKIGVLGAVMAALAGGTERKGVIHEASWQRYCAKIEAFRGPDADQQRIDRAEAKRERKRLALVG